MTKLIACSGVPASGKSTWAKEQVERGNGLTKRINRDTLREMLDNGRYSSSNELQIVEIRDYLITKLLKEGYDVIIDETNLPNRSLDKLKMLAEQSNAKFEIKDFTNVPVEECIERDKSREKPVGTEVIHGMYRKYFYVPGSSEVHSKYFETDGTNEV